MQSGDADAMKIGGRHNDLVYISGKHNCYQA